MKSLTGTLANHNHILRPASLHWIQTSQHRFWIALNNPTTDTYISGTLARGGQWEPTIVRVIEKYLKPNQLFVDVGANIGYFSALARHLGARVESFEPVAGNYQRMMATRERMSPNGSWNLHHNAVSSRSDIVVHLNTADARVNSGNYKISNSGTNSIITTTLDDTIHEHVRILKIDVEGHEARVLDGARQLIGNYGIDIIIMEITHDLMSYPTCRWRDMIHWLLSLGYHMETTSGASIQFHNGWIPHKDETNYVFKCL